MQSQAVVVPVEEVDPLGGVTQLEHTPWDRLTRVIDPGGSESAYTYDALHRLTEVHRHDRLRERYVYDAVGRLVEKQGPEGDALVRYKRGPGSVLMKREGHDGSCEVFERDAHGRKTSATNAQAACTFGHTYGGLRTADLRADEGVRTRFFGREALEVETLGVRVRYLHSDVNTLERIDILRDLRRGEFDVLVGINLLREGLDLPEVSLVGILDADKEGFLRSARSLIQTIGRAARNSGGEVLLYGDRITNAMRYAMEETERRRARQLERGDG